MVAITELDFIFPPLLRQLFHQIVDLERTQMSLSGVAVEKLPFSQNSRNLGNSWEGSQLLVIARPAALGWLEFQLGSDRTQRPG
jgi:hypothetical protein